MNHTRYFCSSYLRDSVVYSALAVKYMLKKLVKNTGEEHIVVVNTWIVVVCM